jgi:hypothetical protein
MQTGIVPVAVRLQLLDLLLDLRVRRDVRGAVDLDGDRLDLVPQRLLLVVDEAELRLALLDDLHHFAGDIGRSRAALGPVAREHQRDVELLHGLGEELVLRGGVRREVVDRDDAGQPVMVAHVVHVALEVRDALLQSAEILRIDLLQVGAAVILERADGRDEHHGRGTQPRLAALDVDELLRPEVGAEARLGHDVVRELERGGGGEHRIAAVRDVRERTAVNEGGIVLESLHQIRLQRLLEQHRHRTLRIEVASADRAQVAPVSDDDVAEPLLQVARLRARQKIAITSEATTMSNPSWRGKPLPDRRARR